MDRKSKLQLLLVALFLLGLMIPIENVFAAMCSGDNCTGLYADSSCQGTSGATPFTYGSAYIEPRSSSVCKAQWTRVTNVAPGSRWTAGSTRYGGTLYEMYHQSTQSASQIGYGSSIYTQMVGGDGGLGVIDKLGCGRVSTSQISLPVGGSQPHSSPYCSGVW